MTTHLSRPCFECCLPSEHDFLILPGGSATVPLCGPCLRKALEGLKGPTASCAPSDLGARTRAGQQAKKALGQYYAGKLPYGQALAEDGKTLIPNEAEQAVIARILVLHGEGHVPFVIAKTLLAEGLKSRGGPMMSSQIIRIINGQGLTQHRKFRATPYGKALAEDGETLVPCEPEQATIRRILELHQTGLASYLIALELRQKGVPARRGKMDASLVARIIKSHGGTPDQTAPSESTLLDLLDL